MKKVAVTIEKHEPAGQWHMVGGPTEDVAGQIALAKSQAVARGAGEGTLLVISTVGLEKRYKVGPAPAKGKK